MALPVEALEAAYHAAQELVTKTGDHVRSLKASLKEGKATKASRMAGVDRRHRWHGPRSQAPWLPALGCRLQRGLAAGFWQLGSPPRQCRHWGVCSVVAGRPLV